MKRKNSMISWLLVSVAIICLAMFLPNIIAHRPVTYGTDLKPEQFFFNMEFTNLLNRFFRTGTLPFYSWSMFLGTNFFSSQTFYIMGDVFTWLSLLLQNINFFDKTLILEIVKFFISAIAMYNLLKEMKISDKVSLFGGICYAFSGWAVFYSGQLMFHSFYCFVPLYFWGIEKYLKDNKKMLFLFSTALLLISHWYLFYTVSFLSPFYFIYRYSLIKKDFSKIIPDTMKLIGVYFVGVFIGGVFLIPTITYMIDNNRAGLILEVLFREPQVYLHILASMFAPNYHYIYGVNAFETTWHVTREICIWAGSLTALLMSQLFWIKDKDYRKKTLIFYGILMAFALIPIGDAALHGFGEPSFRWTFLLTMFNILTACHLLNEPELIDKKKLKISLILIFIFCLLIIPVTAAFEGEFQTCFNEFGQQMLLYLISGIMIVICGVLLNKNKVNVLIVLTVFEFAISGSMLYIRNMDRTERGTYDFADKVTHVLQDEDGQLNDYLNYLDPINYEQYYRVFVPHDSIYWNYSHNLSVAYQLNGLMIYDSTYSPSLNKLKELDNDIVGFNSAMIYNIETGNLMDFLNVKYALVLSEEELPENVEWKLIQNDFRGNICIYQNMNYRALGTTYNTVMTYDDYFEKEKTSRDLNDFIFCESKDLEEIQKYIKSQNRADMTGIYYGGNELTGTIVSDEDSFAVLTLPFDRGWKILVNGQEIKKYSVNGGFIGIPVEKGENLIQMYFMPYGFKAGVLLSAFGMILAAVIWFFERKNRVKIK